MAEQGPPFREAGKLDWHSGIVATRFTRFAYSPDLVESVPARLQLELRLAGFLNMFACARTPRQLRWS
jgi:hypothetical protein